MQEVRVATGSEDEDGVLIFVDDRLVAVVVRLAQADHGELGGAWFVEAGFGLCANAHEETFPALSDVTAWIGRQLARSS